MKRVQATTDKQGISTTAQLWLEGRGHCPLFLIAPSPRSPTPHLFWARGPCSPFILFRHCLGTVAQSMQHCRLMHWQFLMYQLNISSVFSLIRGLLSETCNNYNLTIVLNLIDLTLRNTSREHWNGLNSLLNPWPYPSYLIVF